MSVILIYKCVYLLSFQEHLRIGGHGRLLHSGMSALREESSIFEESLDEAARIPACVLYFRLLPHGQVETLIILLSVFCVGRGWGTREFYRFLYLGVEI